LRLSRHLGVLLVLVTLNCSCSSHDQPRVENPLTHLRKGQYLREDYIHALCETLSPLEASRPDADPQLFTLDSDKNGAYLMPIHNFHEGDDPHRVSREGRLQIDSNPQGIVDTNLAFNAGGMESFTLMKGSSQLSFRFVGDAGRWVSDSIIAGTYRDAMGKQYSFEPGGQAVFPGGRRFDYTLSMDHILTHYDYIYSEKLGLAWMAKIDSKSLVLYETSGDIGETVSPTPKWQLTRLTPVACK